MKQPEPTKRYAKQLSRIGYRTRRCKTCGFVERKAAFKWVCDNCKSGHKVAGKLR